MLKLQPHSKPSTQPLKHRPYSGRTGSFEIGLRPLEIKNWIEIDGHLARYLNEKHRLYREIPERVFVAEEETQNAQREVLDMLVAHLMEYHGDQYSLSQNNKIMNIHALESSIELDDDAMPDLLKASFLLQEDLLVMRKSETGWRLVAGSLSFPSSWKLREKFGKPLDEIHAPVPGFQSGTRNAGMIERIFDNLKPEQPTERFNWSLYNDDVLYHDDRFAHHIAKTDLDNQEYFIRVEHQTLRKLPISGDILFSIRIHIDPFETLAKRDDKRELAAQFILMLENMTHPQLSYKGLIEMRENLIKRLEDIGR